MNTLYERIQDLCDTRGIKVGKLSSEISVRRSILSDLKAGRKKMLSAETLSKIAEYFGVSVDYLLNPGLYACTICGLCYDSSYPNDVKEHNKFHKTFCNAVGYFGDACRPKQEWASMKKSAYDILDCDKCSAKDKADALLTLIKAYFSRSLSNWQYSREHPKFNDYVAMLLNQERFEKYNAEAYNILLEAYGKKAGIPEGETTYKIGELISFTQKEKPSTVPKNLVDSSLTFDDFAYAMHNASGTLSDEEKDVILNMAKQFEAARKLREKHEDSK